MNDTQQPKQPKRTWVWVVVGISFVLVVLAIGGITFTALWFRQNLTVTEISDNGATTEFDAIRARFAGQQPLIELRDGRPQYIEERATRKDSNVPLKTMHVMAFDRDEGKMVSFSLPFWLLRLKSGPIRLSAYSQGWDDRGVSFRVEDLEKYGPGLLMDLTESDEGRVLIWVE